MSTNSYKELRWILRGLSGLIIGFSLMMFIGEYFFGESPSEPLSKSSMIGLSIAGIGLLGLGLAWKWELLGGIIGLIPFFVLALMDPSILQSQLMFIWPLTALLFIVYWFLNKKKTAKKK